MRNIYGAIAIGLALASAMPGSAATCSLATDDERWLVQALANWRVAEHALLKLAAAPLPTIYAVDGRCVFTGKPASDGRWRWAGVAHGGTVRLPGGKTVPLGPISFAANDDGDAVTGYFAMSLPSVWRAAGITSRIGLERLMDGVLLHEMMHTRQFYFVNPRLFTLTRQYALGDDIGDDSLQDRFKSDPAYVAAYTAERDMLFGAAAAPTDAAARMLASKALVLMRARRARWFTGAEVKWRPLDDIFLTMEGLGQWLGYAWATSPQGGRLPAAAALPGVRRDGQYWTQDEGLALFLTIDRLLPGWQALAFAPKPLFAEALLERAATPARRPATAGDGARSPAPQSR